jgi:hypothetical protein
MSAGIIAMQTLTRQVDDLGVHFHEDESAYDRPFRGDFKKSRIKVMGYRKSSVLLFRIQFDLPSVLRRWPKGEIK